MLRRILSDSHRAARRLYKNTFHTVRQQLPYPKFWAAVSSHRVPTRSIAGNRSGLNRPEGVAFSPSGDLMAIANSSAYAVNLHARTTSPESVYQCEPFCTITDPDRLDYVHDIAFSPCGKMLAAVAREAHSISLFARNTERLDWFATKPTYTIQGEECGLSFPSGVAYHPTGQWLVVANRYSQGITCYRKRGPASDASFESVPFQTISENELLANDLAPPHGVDFSPDGRFLLIAHDKFRSLAHIQGESGLSVFRCNAAPGIGIDPNQFYPLFKGLFRPHATAFHPSGNFFAVAKQLLGVEVFQWHHETRTATSIATIPLLQAGQSKSQGAKGVSFTRDGEQLVVTTQFDEVLFFSKWGR